MKSEHRKANVLLLLAAAVWGFAFVAQRVGMRHLQPLTFNGIRFALGAAALLPLLWFGPRSLRYREGGLGPAEHRKLLLRAGLVAGLIITGGATL